MIQQSTPSIRCRQLTRSICGILVSVVDRTQRVCLFDDTSSKLDYDMDSYFMLSARRTRDAYPMAEVEVRPPRGTDAAWLADLWEYPGLRLRRRNQKCREMGRTRT